MTHLLIWILTATVVVTTADAARVHDGAARAESAACVTRAEGDAWPAASPAAPPESTRRGCDGSPTAPSTMDGLWITEC